MQKNDSKYHQLNIFVIHPKLVISVNVILMMVILLVICNIMIFNFKQLLVVFNRIGH